MQPRLQKALILQTVGKVPEFVRLRRAMAKQKAKARAEGREKTTHQTTLLLAALPTRWNSTTRMFGMSTLEEIAMVLAIGIRQMSARKQFVVLTDGVIVVTIMAPETFAMMK